MYAPRKKVGTKKYVIVGKEKTQVPAIGVLIGETTLDPSRGMYLGYATNMLLNSHLRNMQLLFF